MSNTKIGIVGAGIQGVCNALFLQKKNYEVYLFDREEPGSAASYGNAGHFSPYASVPLNIIFSTFVFLNLPPFFKNRSNNFNNTFLGLIVCLALG